MSNERRVLKVNPHLIFDVISKQAGTIGKGLSEGICNAIDASASRCDVTLTSDSFSLQDDGKGFASRTEIEEFFETFGTPHKKGDAVFGRFRIGRGQMLAAGLNRWRSGEFFMEVDLQNKGLEYVLRQTPDDVARGCRIDVDLYDRLSPSDLDAAIREVKELAAYSPMHITLNGERVDKERASIKWDYEDDDCLIRFNAGSTQLKVYNLGIFVRGYRAADTGGVGGVIVSKRQLEVNFARNDILNSQCEVWKRIRKLLTKMASERIGKKQAARVTDDERQMQLRMFLTGQIGYRVFEDLKIFPAFPSGYVSLSTIVSDSAYRRRPLVILSRGDNERVAEMVERSKLGRVLRGSILEWAGVENGEGLIAALKNGIRLGGGHQFDQQVLDRVRLCHLSDVSAGVSESHKLLSNADLKPIERAILVATQAAAEAVYREMVRLDRGFRCGQRELRLGESATALAWTDGSRHIGVDRKYAAECVKSLAGIGALMGTLVHEYLHDTDDSGSHLHDGEFYERFHNFILQGAGLNAQIEFLRVFQRCCRARNIKLPSQLKRNLDVMFSVVVDDKDVDGDEADQPVVVADALGEAQA